MAPKRSRRNLPNVSSTNAPTNAKKPKTSQHQTRSSTQTKVPSADEAQATPPLASKELDAPKTANTSKARAKGTQSAAADPSKAEGEDGEVKLDPPKKRFKISPDLVGLLDPEVKLGPLQHRKDDNERRYWLIKSEPVSRIEKGKAVEGAGRDIRFSIEDLEACEEPEPWDGVRNYAARRNLLSMRAGDLCFFYHSNSREPGIVGIAEVVSVKPLPDKEAFDPTSPYYDPLSTPESPRWWAPTVKFHRKFNDNERKEVSLERIKQIRQKDGERGVLSQMELVRQVRLSVTKVSNEEWDFLMGCVDKAPPMGASS